MKKTLNKLVIKNLQLNKKRTISTIIGIILSTAMICAVAGVFSSLQQTAIQHTIEADGDYHTIFYNVPKDEQKYILENRNVKSYFITQNVGHATIGEYAKDNRVYLQLKEFDESALNNFGLTLTKGRFPENNNELLISEYYLENLKDKVFDIGDKIILNIGDLDVTEQVLNVTQTKQFTIVGIIKRPNWQVGTNYTVITKLNEINQDINIAVKFKNIRDTYKLTREIAEDKNATEEDLNAYLKTIINSNSIAGKWMPKFAYETNVELLKWSGVTEQSLIMKKYSSLALIVIAIIVIASILVIKNSFEMSITGRIKQYGILASIGATRKQIKKNAILEGIILGVIAIPIGILLGIIATFVLMQLTTQFIGKVAFQDPIICAFYIPFSVILISVVSGFITIYLSCILAVRKASNVAPIEAIKNAEQLNIKAKNLKIPAIIKKTFGVGGEIAYKNLKINKKKNRTIVFSIIISITIFISIFSFVEYSFKTAAHYYKAKGYNISISARHADLNNKEVKNYYKYFKDIATEFNLEKYTIRRKTYMYANIEDKMTDEFKEVYLRDYEEKWREMGSLLTITSLGEAEYIDYVEKIGGNYEDYKDGIIYCDNSSTYNAQKEPIQVFDFELQDEINGTLTESQEKVNLKIVAVTKELPMASEWNSAYGMFIVSDELMNKIGNYECDSMQINSKHSHEICQTIEEKYETISKDNNFVINISNYQKEIDAQNGEVLLVSIFLYGFIAIVALIAITNIFNIISTNMNLRSKEFAMLKSIGMTKKELNKMINLESIFYAVKSLIIGILLGTGMSYWIYNIVNRNMASRQLEFIFPIKPIIICILIVIIIIGTIMRYSLKKINKQNVIETIRNENR